VSTTVRTAGPAAEAAFNPPAPVVLGFTPRLEPGTWVADAGPDPIAGLGVVVTGPGVEGVAPVGLDAGAAAPAGRGGKEILMVSLRRSAGGLGAAVGGVGEEGGIAGALGVATPPGGFGICGAPGTPGGLGNAGAPGAAGVGGLGIAGGANLMVSFFMPGGTGACPGGFGAVGRFKPGGLGALGAVGRPGGLGGAGMAGTPGGLGGVGGNGTPSGIVK